MVCPKCGSPVGKNDEFCKSCGYPVPSGSPNGGKKKTPVFLLALIVVVEIAIIGVAIGLLLLKSPGDTKDSETTAKVEKIVTKDSEKEESKEKEADAEAEAKEDAEAESKNAKSNAEEQDAEKEADTEAEPESQAEPEPEPEPEPAPTVTPVPQNTPAPEAILVTDQNSIANIRAAYQKLTTDKVVSATASTTIQQTEVQNPPINMLDDDKMTNWQEGAQGSGLGEYADFVLNQQYTVTALTFRLGNWKTDRYFYGNNRPKTLQIQTGESAWTVTFPDKWDECAVQFSSPVLTDTLRITIADVYRGSDWDDTVITDACIWYQ